MTAKLSLASSATYPETRREVSKLLGISQATLRTWDRLFRQWLEAPVGQKGNATRKRYTPNDVRVFWLVKQRRDAGQNFSEIKASLSDALLEEQMVDDIVISAETPAMNGRNALAARIYELELELATLRAQNKSLQSEYEQLREALQIEHEGRLAAERDAAHALGQAAALGQMANMPTMPRSASRPADAEEEPSGRKKKRNPPSWWRGFER
jgi:DNA-binding transcriptional MerR regulator